DQHREHVQRKRNPDQACAPCGALKRGLAGSLLLRAEPVVGVAAAFLPLALLLLLLCEWVEVAVLVLWLLLFVLVLLLALLAALLLARPVVLLVFVLAGRLAGLRLWLLVFGLVLLRFGRGAFGRGEDGFASRAAHHRR